MSSLCLRISKPDYESKYFNSYVNAYKKKKIPCGFKKKQQQKVYPQEKKATAPSL